MLVSLRVCVDTISHVYLSSEMDLACGVGRQLIGAYG